MKYITYIWLIFMFLCQIYKQDIIGSFGYCLALIYFYELEKERNESYNFWQYFSKKLKENEVGHLIITKTNKEQSDEK